MFFFCKFANGNEKKIFMELKILKRLFLGSLLSIVCIMTNAQTKNNAFMDYIEKYKDIAVKQMELHGIPASIILAQGLLESGAGSSELAKKSNNHFGIKCGSDWFGPTITHYDDGRNEYFRVYDNVTTSYEDHSLFLKKERYSRLFRLNILDYAGWARGLKSCGYATSPTYANRLISIIELYELNKLDKDPSVQLYIPEMKPIEDIEFNTHHLLSNNEVLCIQADIKDSWDSLSKEFALSKEKLLQYNEAIENVEIHAGDYIYLQKKQSKASKQYGKGYWHHVKQGESMYSIAQLYAMNIKTLYRLNFKDTDYIPVSGDLLRVR